MARLKVKQIEDFTSAVQNLIDNDTDQNAGLIDALEASVDSLEGATGAATGDLEASVDSLETVASTAITERGELSSSVDSLAVVDGELSDAIDAEASRAKVAEGYLASSVDSLEVALGDEETARINEDARLEGLINANAGAIGDNDADIAELVASVDSIEILDGQQNESIDSLETAISNILDIPGTDLDQFSEMVTFVKSVDTVNDGLLSDFIGVANASVDSLELVASTAIDERGDIVASIDSLELATGGNTAALEASIDSLEDVDAGLADDIQAVQDNLDDYATWTNASIDSLESVDTALSDAIDQNSSDISTNKSGIDANLAAIGDLQASVDSLESVDAALAGAIDDNASNIDANAFYLHQIGTVNPNGIEFSITNAVRFGANDDLKISVNGHVLHPVLAGGADGYATVDGIKFDVSKIGYTVDENDHIYVIGIRA
jgi:gas vesicle protein